MADQLGPIPIPVPAECPDFPLKPDYESSQETDALLFTHLFDSPGLQTEQRFLAATPGGVATSSFHPARNHSRRWG